jgi:hypothetical protein
MSISGFGLVRAAIRAIVVVLVIASIVFKNHIFTFLACNNGSSGPAFEGFCLPGV